MREREREREGSNVLKNYIIFLYITDDMNTQIFIKFQLQESVFPSN